MITTKLSLIILLTIMIAFAIPSYFQPLFLIPTVMFALAGSVLLSVESLRPSLDKTREIEKRLDQMEKTLKNFNFAKLR
jgi:hypothetical protein